MRMMTQSVRRLTVPTAIACRGAAFQVVHRGGNIPPPETKASREMTGGFKHKNPRQRFELNRLNIERQVVVLTNLQLKPAIGGMNPNRFFYVVSLVSQY